METIVVSDACERIKEEIQQLRMILAALTAERDDLKYHTCPELTARYAREIGEYEHRIKCQRIMILEMKRRIEIARAALNREKTVSQEAVDEQVEKEYEEFHRKVEEEYQKAQEAKEEQERREQQRRRYEQQWQEKYGDRWEKEQSAKENDGEQQTGEEAQTEADRDKIDGADGADAEKQENGQNDRDTGEEAGREGAAEDAEGAEKAEGTGGAEAEDKGIPNPKELFRKIVKKLHPDMNPDITEREKELFSKAVKAYQDGDLVTLQEIYDEVFGDGSDAPPDKEMTYPELVELRDKLQSRIKEVKEEIDIIKESFPYTSKEFLDDEEAVAARQQELEEQIHQYEETWKNLTKILADINEEMEELRNRQK